MTISNTIFKSMIFISLLAYGGFVQGKNIYDLTINDIGGKPIALKDYKGKVLLISNIATQCGYTPQLDGLEELYQKFNDQGFAILGVPSNDFGGQTPEEADEVKKFCKLNYGVTFPLTSKTVVKGSEKHPLVKFLTESSDNKNEIAWNFEKFLVDGEGKVVARYKSSVKPMDPTVLKKVKSLTSKD